MQINKLKLFRNIILFALAIGVIGGFFANRFIKTKGFDNLSDFIANYWSNRSLRSLATVKELRIYTADKDYAFLQNKREEGLARGIQINEGENYVDCEVVLDKDTTKGELRLKGHMTDHLEGKKWSFRVKTDQEIMGMYRFSLQNPATRNYAYEWVYHQLLKNENIIALKYDFLNLSLNDQDLGIYAVEEHFGQHIPEDNGRPKGAILRWDPALYWYGRINELEGVYMNESYSNFEASFVDAYDNGTIKNDPALIDTYLKGAALLEDFRRGNKSAAEVFDIELFAKFHAIIDLVGGHHSLDWSDVKFFYNAKTSKLEPVGYESFSIRLTEQIAGQRLPDNYENLGNNYHDLLFADPLFYEAYIRNLTRICTEEYVSDFQSKIQNQLNEKLGILAHEFAYIKFSWSGYFKNVELIRKNIELPKAFHAFLEDKSDSTVTISLTPVSDFPIEILALNINNKEDIKTKDKFVLPAKARKSYTNYFYVTFEHDSKKLKNLTLKAKIPGGNSIFTVDISDLPSYKKVDYLLDTIHTNVDDQLFFMTTDSTAQFKTKQVEINATVTIPKGVTLRVGAAQKIVFEAEGMLIVNGCLKLMGEEDRPICIYSNSNKTFPILINAARASFNYVNFIESNGSVMKAQNAKVAFANCAFSEIKGDFLTALQSDVFLTQCASGKLSSLGVFDRSDLFIEKFTANFGNSFLNAYGSYIRIVSSDIKGYNRVAQLDEVSSLYAWKSTFTNNELLASLNKASFFKSFEGMIKSNQPGFQIKDRKSNFPSKYELYKTKSVDMVGNVVKQNL